jgi:hypothetical protein
MGNGTRTIAKKNRATGVRNRRDSQSYRKTILEKRFQASLHCKALRIGNVGYAVGHFERCRKMNTTRIEGPIADSYVIARSIGPSQTEWLTPDREWQRSIFEAARFELDEKDKAEWWLERELTSAMRTDTSTTTKDGE